MLYLCIRNTEVTKTLLLETKKNKWRNDMRRDIKVGDRIYYECYDNTIGSAIVTKIEPRTYWDNGKRYDFNMLFTGLHSVIEDYNTLAPSNPKVRAYIKEVKAKRKALINEALMFAYPDRKDFSKEERKACDRLLDFAHMKYKELEESE